MSDVIDRRVVEMEFDNSNFEKNTKETMSTLDKFKKKLDLDGASKGLEEVSAAAVATANKFSALDAAAFTAINNITNRLVNHGINLAKSLSVDQVTAGWGKFEEKTAAVQTIMAATGMSIEDVNKQLDKLNWFTDETSYNFTDMVNNIGKFTSNNIELDTAVTAMEGIATWAAISGQNASTASRVMYNLSQAIGMGALKLQDWKSVELANMGTTAFKQTAIETGIELGTLVKKNKKVVTAVKGTQVTIENFRETLSDGWMDTKTLLGTLSKYGSFADKLNDAVTKIQETQNEFTATDLLEQINEYSDKMKILDAVTENGVKSEQKIRKAAFDAGMSFSAMSDFIDGLASKEEMLAELSEETGMSIEELVPMMDELGSGALTLGRNAFRAAQEAKTLTDAIDATKDAVSTQWMKTFEYIIGDKVQATEFFTELTNRLWDIFAASGAVRNEVLEMWNSFDEGGRNDFIDAFWEIWDAFSNIADNIKQAWHEVFPKKNAREWAEVIKNITLSIKAFAHNFKMVTQNMEGFRVIIKGVASSLSIVKKVFDKVSEVFYAFGYYVIAPIIVFLYLLAQRISSSITWFDEMTNECDLLSGVVEVLKAAIFALGKVVEFVISAIESGIEAVHKLYLANKEVIDAFFGRIAKVFVNIKDSILNFAEWLSQWHFDWDKVFAIFSLENIKNVFKNFAGMIVNFFSNIGENIKRFAAIVSEKLGGINWAGVLGLASLAIILVQFLKVFNLIIKIGRSVTAFIESAKSITTAIAKVTASVSKMFKGVSFYLHGKGFEKFAQGIALIAASLIGLGAAVVALSYIKTENMWETIGMIAALAAIITTLTLVTALVTKDKTMAFMSLAAFMLSISAATLILIYALKEVAKIKRNSTQAILSITAIVGMLTLAAAALAKAAPKLTKGSFTLLAIAAGVWVLVKAMKGLAEINTKAIVHNLGGLLLALTMMTVLMVALQSGHGGALKMAIALPILSAGMLALVGVLKVMSMVPNADITKGLNLMVKLSAIVTGVSLLAKLIGSQGVKMAAAFLSFSTSMLILVGVLFILKLLKPEDMVAPMLAMGALMLVLGIATKIASSGRAFSSGFKSLLGLSAAILALTVSVMALSLVDTGKLLGVAAGMAAMLLSFGLVAKFAGTIKEDSFKTIAILTAAIAVFAISLGVLSLIDTVILYKVAGALAVLMTAMTVMIMSTELAKDVLKPIIALTAVVAAISGILFLLSTFTDADKVIKVAASLSELMVVFAGLTAAIGIIGTYIKSAAVLEGLIMILEVIGLLGLVAVLLGGINSIFDGGLARVIESATEVMYNLSKFIGSIVGGFVDGVLAFLPGLGKDLSDFWNNGKDFFEGVQGINEGVGNGVKALAQALLIMTGSSILDSIASFFSGSSSMSKFTEEMPKLGEAIKSFSASISELSDEDVSKAHLAAETISAIAEVGSALPKHDGLLQAIIGDNDFIKFSKELNKIGPAIVEYAEEAKKISEEDVEAVKRSADAITAMTEAGKALPKHGGFIQKIIGDNDFIKFAEELNKMGPSIIAYAKRVQGITQENVEAIKRSATAISAMSEVGKALPKHGGFLQKITGDNDLGKFAEELKAMTPAVYAFAASSAQLLNVNIGGVKIAASLIGQMSEVANALPRDFGLIDLFIGRRQSFKEFIDSCIEAVPSIELLIWHSRGMKPRYAAKLIDVGNVLKVLSDVASSLPNVGGLKSLFTGNILDIKTFSKNLSGAMPSIMRFARGSALLSDTAANDIKKSASCFESLAAVADQLPKTGGIKTFFEGKIDIKGFLDLFAPSSDTSGSVGSKLKNYSDSVKSLSTSDVNAISRSADSLGALAEVASKVKEATEDGLFTSFQGIDEFVDSLFDSDGNSIGVKLKEYAASVVGLTTAYSDSVINSANVIRSLADVGKYINDNDYIDELVSAVDGLSYFEDYYAPFIQSFAALGSYDITSALDMFNSIITATFATKDVDVNAIEAYGDALKSLANNGVDAFAKVFSDAANNGTAEKTGSALGEASKTGLFTQISKFEGMGEFAVRKFVDGIARELYKAKDSGELIGESTLKAINRSLMIQSPSKKTKESGKYVVEGLALGIKRNMILAERAAGKVGDSTIDSMNEALGVHSPSIFGFFSGSNLIKGFVNGVMDKLGIATGAADETGTSVIDTLKESLGLNSGESIGSNFINSLGNGISGASGAVLKGVAQETAEEIRAYMIQAGLYAATGLEKNMTISKALKKYSAEALIDRGMAMGEIIVNQLSDSANRWHKYVQEVDDDGNKLTLTYKDGAKAFNNYVDNIASGLESLTDSFEKFTSEGMSVDAMISGMVSQTKAQKTWAKNIKTLLARGFDPDILEEIVSKGIGDSFATIKNLVKATDNEIIAFQTSYKKNAERIAKTSAEIGTALASGVTDEFKASVKEVTASVGTKMQMYGKVFVSPIKEITSVIQNGYIKALENLDLALDRSQNESLLSYIKSLYEKTDAFDKDTKSIEENEKALDSSRKKYNKLVKINNTLVNIQKKYNAETDPVKLAKYDKQIAEQIKLLNKLAGTSINETNVTKAYKVITKQIKATTKEIEENNQAVTDSYEEMANNVAAVYQDIFDSIADPVKSFINPLKSTFSSVINMFEKFSEDEELTAETIANNMQSQVDGYLNWKQNLEIVRSKGVSEAFMTYLESLGISGASTVRALAAATETELERVDWLFAQEVELGEQSIIDQMKADGKAKNDTLQKWYQDLLVVYKRFGIEFGDELKALGIDAQSMVSALANASDSDAAIIKAAYDSGAEIAKLIADGIIEGIYAKDVSIEDSVKTTVSEETKGVGVDAGESTVIGVKEGMVNATPEASETAKTSAETILEPFTTTLNKSSGKKLGNKFVNGIKASFAAVKSDELFADLTTAVQTGIKSIRKNFRSKFVSAGEYITRGFVSGIANATILQEVVNAATEMANAALGAVRQSLDIHSPSKAFAKLGEYSSLGFVNGLSEYIGESAKTGKLLGDEALDGLGNSILQINNMVNDEFDSDPVIRPIVDLTDATTKAAMLNDMFSSGRSTYLGATISAERAGSQNGQLVMPDRTEIEGMIDRAAAKYAEQIAVALDGVTFETNVGLEPNSTGIFDIVRKENRMFKRRTGYDGV